MVRGEELPRIAVDYTLSPAEIGPNDHLEDAPSLTIWFEMEIE